LPDARAGFLAEDESALDRRVLEDWSPLMRTSIRTSFRTKPETTPTSADVRGHLVAVPADAAARSSLRDPYWAAVVIRPTVAADATALRRLAELDSAPVPDGDTVVAEQGGSLIAAVAISDGASISNPFRPTADIVALVQLRAAQLRRQQARDRRTARPRERRYAPRSAGSYGARKQLKTSQNSSMA
jgi:hypothetical protein